jgi:hypothetical protein
MTLKQEWLTYSDLNRTPEDIWLRHKIAKLFDLREPSESQSQLRCMANVGLSLSDLPANAYPNHETELRALALKEFGPPPRVLIPTALILLLVAWMQRRGWI